MKNKLSCGVVRDLLPSYIEHLTCAETDEAVQAHLAACAACQREYEAMTMPEAAPEADKEAQREVEYLSRVDKKLREQRKMIWIYALAAAIALVPLIGWGLRTYIIGTPLRMQDLEYSIQNKNGYMLVDVHMSDSSMEIKDWEEKKGAQGELYLSGKKVKKSPLVQGIRYELGTSADTYSRIYILDTLVWADGMPISEESLRLYESSTPYVGDPSALQHIADTLGVWETVGGFSYELQTAQAPYGWTLRFEGITPGGSGLDALGAAQMNTHMRRNAVQMLAVVENLGYVSWTYTDRAGALHTETVTEEDAACRIAELVETYNQIYATDWVAKDSVKAYAASPAALEQLRQILELLY